MHVLITGGAGFIGSHLAEHHLAKGDWVHVLDNLSTGRLGNIASCFGDPKFRFDQCDIAGCEHLDAAVQWADRIYHMAAVVGVRRVMEDPIRVLTTNISGTESVLRAAVAGAWKPHVVLASSAEVYGFSAAPSLSENDDLVFAHGSRTRWSYAVTKLADEYLGFAYARQHALPVTMVRLFNTIGPRQRARYGMAVPNFVRRAVAGEPIVVFGDGRQTRSFCDVRDATRMLDELAASPAAAGQVFNVGDDREIAIGDLAEMVRARAGSRSEIRRISYAEAYGAHFDDVRHRRPVLERLRAVISYRPTWTLESTLDDLIAGARGRAEAAVAGGGA